MDTKRYVAGFLFRDNRKEVALILKNRPEFQAGKLNGIGGKIEEKEGSDAAMEREFREETGATVKDWIFFCEINWHGGFVHFFTSEAPAEITTTTDEEVFWMEVDKLQNTSTVDNLKWLVPMAIVALDKPDMLAEVSLPE